MGWDKGYSLRVNIHHKEGFTYSAYRLYSVPATSVENTLPLTRCTGSPAAAGEGSCPGMVLVLVLFVELSGEMTTVATV